MGGWGEGEWEVGGVKKGEERGRCEGGRGEGRGGRRDGERGEVLTNTLTRVCMCPVCTGVSGSEEANHGGG